MDGIPRPRGRGLIEAPHALAGLAPKLQFHDRAVVASLKRGQGLCGAEIARQFHDRAVVASLKPGLPAAHDRIMGEFHDRAVVASLKRRGIRLPTSASC